MDLFRVRLNCVDHYQSTPTQFDPILRNNVKPSQLNKEHKVPVIRVFGSTETGQKVCAHIHGAFPYLYVEYTGDLDLQEVGAYIHRFHLSIDAALCASYRRNVYDGNAKYVARICLVKGVPFYGFHVGYRYYLKIYMLDPIVMTRLADILRQGSVMKKVFQPYEAHLEYILQWMVDYNLYGCGYIDCRKASFRSPVPIYKEMDNLFHLWHDCSVPIELMTDESVVPRVSYCSLEVDICVQDILNRLEVKARPLHHDFIERLDPLAPDEKLVPSMSGLWKDETRRRKSKLSNSEPGDSPFPAEVMISMSADPRNTQPGGWIHEDDYREKVSGLIMDEKNQSDSTVSFETFVKPSKFDSYVRTCLESTEDLYPENLRRALGLTRGIGANYSHNDQDQIEVDENQILGIGLNHDEEFYDSDEEVMREMGLSQREKGDDVEEKRLEPEGLDRTEYDLYDKSHRLRISNGLKRSEPPVTEVDLDKKRQRVDGNLRVDEDALHTEIKPRTVNGASLAASTSKKTFSETPQAKGDPQPLGFFVVKDPQDPETILRLSQKAASQSSTLEYKKHILVDPSISLTRTQGDSLSKTGSRLSFNTRSSLLISNVIKNKRRRFGPSSYKKFRVFSKPPPSSLEVVSTMRGFHLPSAIYQDAFYSDEADVLDRPREWGGREFKLKSSTVPYLPFFDPTGSSDTNFGEKQAIIPDKLRDEKEYKSQRYACTFRSWQIAMQPPTYAEVDAWFHEEEAKSKTTAGKIAATVRALVGTRTAGKLSQIDGPSQKNQYGFKYTQYQASSNIQHEAQYMSTMSLEAHINTRGSFVPNPEEDEVQCLFWCLKSDEGGLESNGILDGRHVGIVAISKNVSMAGNLSRQAAVEVQEESSELDLIIRMVEIVRTHDPDILTGYEVHSGSWGYLIERARLKYDYNLCDEFSRMKAQSHGRFGKDNDKWGFNHTSTIRVTGRHMINIWRAMRSELNLLQYSMENVVFHLLHRRIPHFTWADLTRWYTNGKPRDLAKVVNYYISRVQLDLDILDANELIARTSEQARLLGVDFFSVFSRGSQFKVESLMFRIAKPENFMLASPSRKQVGGQNALECLPLVMEPLSAFYNGPLLVLDFQSLYPSVMIAYNYCYSTFLGRIVNWRGTNKMGFTEYRRQQRLLELLKNHINISPNGMMFTKPEIRKSLLAKMLGEILETRVMVKSGMKTDKDDKALQRLLNNRQLALKLIANVTYGYTSASFSGRMPCSEIADSIVQTGRESLEKAIALIHSVERWGAEVVYGDTDSLFVYLKGRTKDQAFDIGEEIARTVTSINPRPVKLKFEKVYFPCVLLAKKRYVGFKYEHRSQVEPDFDAKGIETVRRDGTPAEQKIEETALKMLFRTADLSQIKSYFQSQCEKIMRGSISVQDFCFAREVKLGTYSNKGPPPPGALISTKKMLEDARTEPQYGERVPYVVITGAPSARLIDRCVAPEELLKDDFKELDSEYYILKNIIPPLERIFNLMGANVRQWYDEMPKFQRIRMVDATYQDKGNLEEVVIGQKTLEFYMKSSSCPVCREKFEAQSLICPACLADKPKSLLSLRTRLNAEERRLLDVHKVCQSCSRVSPLEEVTCDSKDCPVFYTRTKQKTRLKMEKAIVEPAIQDISRGMLDLGDLEW